MVIDDGSIWGGGIWGGEHFASGVDVPPSGDEEFRVSDEEGEPQVSDGDG